MNTDSRVHRLNRELWNAYERALQPGTKAPLAFVIRVRTEANAVLLRGRFESQGCQIAWLKRKWWPSRHRWELAAKTKDTFPLTIETIDQWSDRLQSEVQPYDAILTHWVPAGA